MPEPLISIIVPTYNRAHILPSTIKSLQYQTAMNHEIIIVDDGSTDDTEQVIQPFLNEYTFYHKKQNAERAAARNYGSRLARGQFLNFFDSDDIALVNHTTEAANLIQQYHAPEWFHLAYQWVDESHKNIYSVNKRKGRTINASLKQGNVLACSGVFVRRDIFMMNPFNEIRDLSASEDYECWLRLSAQYPLYYSNAISSLLVDHPERSVRTMHDERLIARTYTFIDLIQHNDRIRDYYKKDLRHIIAGSFSYMALHFSEYIDRKAISIKYLNKALKFSPGILLKRRFYATIRNLIFRWR